MTEATEPKPASVSAAFKCWTVNSGEYTHDEGSQHWGVFWEPLDVALPESAKPSCCFHDSIVFYDRSQNRKLKDHVRHFGFIEGSPNLLFIEGKWREVINGRVEFRNGHWYMRWGVSTNTRYASMLNGDSE